MKKCCVHKLYIIYLYRQGLLGQRAQKPSEARYLMQDTKSQCFQTNFLLDLFFVLFVFF